MQALQQAASELESRKAAEAREKSQAAARALAEKQANIRAT